MNFKKLIKIRPRTAIAGVLVATGASIAVAQADYDDFETQSSNGFGVTRGGEAWRHQGTANFSTVDGVGLINWSGGAGQRSTAVLVDRRVNTELSATFSLDVVPSQGTADLGLLARQTRLTVRRMDAYFAAIRFSTGRVRLGYGKMINGQATFFDFVNTNFAPRAGEQIRLKLSVTGTNPTLIRAKMWPSTAAEPTDWMAEIEDSETVLQGPGLFQGILSQSPSSFAGDVLGTVDDYFATDATEPDGFDDEIADLESQIASVDERIGTLSFDSYSLLQTGLGRSEARGGTAIRTIELASIQGDPRFISITGTCSARGGSAESLVVFLDDAGVELLRTTACSFGSGQYAGGSTSNGTVIPFPDNTTSFQLRVTTSGTSGYFSSSGSVSVDVLGPAD